MSQWHLLTSAQIANFDRRIPVVLPMGAVEQHGPHLPLATDAMIATHFAARLDNELGEGVLVLPTVVVGYSGIHRGFAGTLSLRHSTLATQATDVLGCALSQGFRSALLLNANGGNEGVAQVALEQLGEDWPERHLVRTTWWRVASEELATISETGPGGVGHACELETSLMLAIAPELVHLDAAPARVNRPAFDWDTADLLRPGRATLFRAMSEVAPTGVFGEPRVASPHKGKAISEAVTKHLVDIVRSLGTHR